MAENCVHLCPFLRRVKHEAVNLLTPLKIHLQLLERSAPSDREIRERLEKVEKLLEQLSREIRFIGQLPKLKPVSLGEIFRAASQHWRCEQQDGEIVLCEKYENIHSSGLVLAQAEQLITLLVNLIRNASRFCGPDKKITLKFSAQGARVRVAVCDGGPGFSVQPTEKPCDEQHGHGLSICRQIAEAHGSDLYYSNLPAGGCEVYFYLQRYYLGDPQHEMTFEPIMDPGIAAAAEA